MEASEQIINIDGCELHYRTGGDISPQARPVIILHGWGCRASTMNLFEQTVLARCPGTRVYNLDLPGFGDSQEPPSVYGIDDYVRVLEEFVGRMGISRPILIGHSFGGRMSILYSSRNPVERVILVDAAGIKPRRSLRYYSKVYSFKAAKRLLPFLIGRSRADKVIDRWRGKAGSSDYASASPRMRAILSKVVNEDLTACLPKIKAPTLLIWGENDTATPLRDARLMEKLIPDAGLVSYPDAGHYSFLDRPAQTRAVVESFINSQSKS
ncbi:MAG: alpha/beta hydrolase [Muribaculaceae bacterium]|nr:alpha/beta hydrolase [Muribaculaceae bacterium]